MRFRAYRIAVFIVAAATASGAFANYCSYDVVPAATLLFPFVSYDYEGGPNGQTTQISITNTGFEAQIVRVTVWTDYSISLMNFNVVLTGYDVVRMNMRDILAYGLLPTQDSQTGRNESIWVDDNSNAGGTPVDWGPWSSHNSLHDPLPFIDGLPAPQSTTPLDCDPDDWIASPVFYTNPIPHNVLTLFEAYSKISQTAKRSYLDCNDETVNFPVKPWFLTRDNGPVWLYVTADVVASCNKDMPDSGYASTYFALDRASTDGVLDDNVLIGDTMWINDSENSFEAAEAVHIESIPPDLYPVADQIPTFYFRYTLAFSAGSDSREPLPTAWAVRYQLDEDLGVNTWIRAYKSSSINRTVADLATNTLGPNWGAITGWGPANLYASSCVPYTYYAWDENENVNSVGSGEGPYSFTEQPIRPIPNLFPLETQEVDIDQFFIVRQDPQRKYYGWLLFVWPGSNGAPLGSSAGDTDGWYQTWVGARYSTIGGKTAALGGTVLANFNCDYDQMLPELAVGQFLPKDLE